MQVDQYQPEEHYEAVEPVENEDDEQYDEQQQQVYNQMAEMAANQEGREQ